MLFELRLLELHQIQVKLAREKVPLMACLATYPDGDSEGVHVLPAESIVDSGQVICPIRSRAVGHSSGYFF